MKLDEAIALGKNDTWREAQVRVSPGSKTLWFVMLRDVRNKSFVLANNDDKPIATGDINELSGFIRMIGLKEFSVFL